jgi:hypothetical protein
MHRGSPKPSVRRRVYVQMIVVIICHGRDTRRGLSPCQTGFVLEKSFYDRLPYQQRQKHQKHQKRMTLISLVKCREQEGAVAWRTRHRRQQPGKCITLPLKEDNHAMHPGLGYCFGYRPGRYQEWYIRQGTCSWVYTNTHILHLIHYVQSHQDYGTKRLCQVG